jgi:hypothetical protein
MRAGVEPHPVWWIAQSLLVVGLVLVIHSSIAMSTRIIGKLHADLESKHPVNGSAQSTPDAERRHG